MCEMRESCSCGAAIHVIGYRRAREWRDTHKHETETVLELETNTYPVGFQPEPAEEE